MKNFLYIVVSVSLLLIIFSCGHENPQKVTGVIKKFEPRIQTAAGFYPKVEFTDGRFLYLSDMPKSQVDAGSEIAIYYRAIYNKGLLLDVDSIVTTKPAPKQIAPVDTTKTH